MNVVREYRMLLRAAKRISATAPAIPARPPVKAGMDATSALTGRISPEVAAQTQVQVQPDNSEEVQEEICEGGKESARALDSNQDMVLVPASSLHPGDPVVASYAVWRLRTEFRRRRDRQRRLERRAARAEARLAAFITAHPHWKEEPVRIRIRIRIVYAYP